MEDATEREIERDWSINALQFALLSGAFDGASKELDLDILHERSSHWRSKLRQIESREKH